MKIAEVSIARPVFASMMILALVVFGMTAYSTMGVDLFPDVDFPIVTVTVPYEGADPETVETEVTDVIEEAVNTITGIKTLRIESTEGFAQIFIEFELEEDVNVVSQDVRDKVAGIRGDLPRDIDPPIIEKFDPDSSPILAIVLSGPDSIGELSDYADDVVKPRFEGIPGVGNVRAGGRTRAGNPHLAARRRAAGPCADRQGRDRHAARGERRAAGRSRGNRQPRDDRQDEGQDREGRGLRRPGGRHRDGIPIHLRDVAWVEDGLEDFRSLARLERRAAVSLLVRRQSGSNMLAVATEVKAAAAEPGAGSARGLPADHRPGPVALRRSRASTRRRASCSAAALLAVLVILFFLRSFRGSFVAAITIPTTIIAHLHLHVRRWASPST